MKKKQISLKKLSLKRDTISPLMQIRTLGGNTLLVVSCGDCFTTKCLTKKQCPSLECGTNTETIIVNCNDSYYCQTIDLP